MSSSTTSAGASNAAAPASSASSTTTPPPTVRKSRIPRVLTWSDPVRSGTILGEILVTLFILRYGNLLRLTLKLTYYAIGATGLIEFFSRYLNGSKQGFISSYQPSRYISINQHSLEKYTNRVLRFLVDGLTEVKSLLDAEDLSVSAGAFFAALAMYILTGFVSVSTLAFIATVVAFSVPPLYLQFQNEIDEAVGVVHKQACDQYQNVSNQVHEAAGPHVEKARSQINQYASKVGINLNRGGFPSNSEGSSTGAGAGAGATAASAVGAASGAAASASGASKAKSTDASEKSSSPSLSTEARTIDGVTYDSVPTLAGNVTLDPATDSKPVQNVESVIDDGKVDAKPLTESVEDLGSNLKDDIAADHDLK